MIFLSDIEGKGTLRVRWRLGVRLDRCLKASQLAALTIERPLLYRLAGASRVVLYAFTAFATSRELDPGN